jgi:hypothetical protein
LKGPGNGAFRSFEGVCEQLLLPELLPRYALDMTVGAGPAKVGVIADVFDWGAVPELDESEQSFYSPTHGHFPNGSELAQLDLILVVCPLKSTSAASRPGQT